MLRILHFWPGYTGIVRYGRWSFLGLALVFALVLNVLLILEFFWTSYITPGQRNGLLVAFLVVWGTLHAIASQWGSRIERVKHADMKSDGFREATLQYLRGNWFEAQCCLNMLLKKNPRDTEALLLLATLFRHTKRFEEARTTIGKLEILEEADRWLLEIAAEKKHLDAATVE